jgi:phosphatidylglycerophosphate synthase
VLKNPYAKPAALECNPLNRLLYGIAYPLARVFSGLGCSPNQITALSCVAALMASLALAMGASAWLFALAWSASLVLDFCDGTLARMTRQVSRTAFRFDHTSDLVKICTLLIAAAVQYDFFILWVACSVSIATFMLYNALNHELKVARERNDMARPSQSVHPSVRGATFARTLYMTFGTLNGHTLVFFLLLAVGEAWAVFVCMHLAAISALGSARRVRLLMALPKN